ncbi:MAG: hypothetical protein HOI95_14095 [Chromatiales bacterium]|nr:hypothetical protein [Chromatiales bacterium]
MSRIAVFDPNVPMKTIHCSVARLEGESSDEYEVVREERAASYVVLKYTTPVMHRAKNTLISPAAPASLWRLGTIKKS